MEEIIKLTEFEYRFLNKFTNNGLYLVRDKDGILSLYDDIPKKSLADDCWENPSAFCSHIVLSDSDLFLFVDWEDEHPYEVDWILENCEVIIKNIPKSPWDGNVLACPNCGSGKYLYNEDGNENEYCGLCGQRIDWSNEEDESY